MRACFVLTGNKNGLLVPHTTTDQGNFMSYLKVGKMFKLLLLLVVIQQDLNIGNSAMYDLVSYPLLLLEASLSHP